MGYFLPKEPAEPEPEKPQEQVDLPPVHDTDGVVHGVDGVVQDVDDIINNSFQQSSHLKPIVDSSNTTKDYKQDSLFMEFYKNYPNKQKPVIAHKAFLKHKPDADFVAMLVQDLESRIANNWKGRDKSKIPFPATYLNGREWEGEIHLNQVSTNRPSTKYKSWDEIVGDVA
jgi:hypothetical protein